MRIWQYAGAVLAVSVTLALGGCGTESSEPDDTTAEDTMSSTDPSDSASQSMSGSASSSGPALPQVAQDAVADLAGMLGVDASEVDVVRVEQVTWRDGSIGCAEPGSMYTQALVDGQRVVLSAGGREYEYHAGGSRDAFHCENPTE
ncbi:hypothetical protein [Nocardioides sp. Soil796]|uniref:hypothetical protein n=1 Tax=Nocardioides sp. Soil796 TaxID=1736412 RepID=UPI00070F783B|nr:hypothetical protein [Nocardioides sp. Soil796]KRF12623.1 hypothetical protein ASH02_13805 [Nocardioides sp. Soil796]